MSPDFDIIIIGSGPAGVSVAFPLVQAGLKVLMVDGGKEANHMPPFHPFLRERVSNAEQWKWMVGEDFWSLRQLDAVSPKLRVPLYDYVFEDFLSSNRIQTKNFIAVGSLAKGGLSNAWGCGVARLSAKELVDFPFLASEMEASYERVTRRIGVSGANADDLSDYFGLDAWSGPPIQMDKLHHRLFENYSASSPFIDSDFRLGRSRVAVLSQDQGERAACNISGNCLWGCHRKSLYSSTYDIAALMQHDNFYYQSGFIVDRIDHDDDMLVVQGCNDQNNKTIKAKKIALAAGTLATTRLALQALQYEHAVRLQSCPTAAFLLWLPKMLGLPRTDSFGLGQLSYTLDLIDGVKAFGSTFSTVGIPMTEFARHLPLSKRYGIDLLKSLLSSCLVGNVFLPGHLSTSKAQLKENATLEIEGGFDPSVKELMSEVARQLRKAYWKYGAWLLPLSFTIGKPGGDIHYASTLPMRLKPVLGETNAQGELVGLAGVHIVDGASLPILSEKSHTLTIMANADRIGHVLAIQMKENLIDA